MENSLDSVVQKIFDWALPFTETSPQKRHVRLKDTPLTSKTTPFRPLTLRQEKLLTFFLSLIQFTSIMDFVIMMPLGPQFMRVFQIGPSEFGMMVSAYTFSAGVFGIVGAFFLDRFDRKRALLVLYLGFSIGTLLCALAPDHRFFVLARMVAGAFGGVLGATIFSIIGDMIPESRRGAATGRVMSAFALASILGIPFGLKLATEWNWRAPFFLLTAMSVILLAIGAYTLPLMRRHLERGKSKLPPKKMLLTLMKPHHLRAYLLTAGLMVAGFSVIPFMSPYMVSNTGFEEKNLMYIYLFGGSATFFTSPLIGRLADLFGKYRIFACFATFSIFPILLVTHLGVSPFWVVISSMTLFMIGTSGRMVPAMALVTSSALPHERGGFMSINSSVQQFTSGAAAFMGGLIIQKSAEGPLTHFDLVGYIAVATTLICLWLAKRVRPVSAEKSSSFAEVG